MATQEDRSLSSGMSFPQWMKTRKNDRFDLQQSAFSPTELDDSFMFYYRNKVQDASSNSSSTIVNAKTLIQHPQQPSASSVAQSKPDFSKHTPYCQKFLQGSIDSTTAQQVQFPSATKTKSSGVDDGFKGEAARCGSSVIRVAHQMVAGKITRGFDSENKQNCDLPPTGFDPSLRRGSKSLPASPLTSPSSSPKSRRRINKYFTGPFGDGGDHHGSWILSNLLSRRKELSQSVGMIAEEPIAGLTAGVSVSSVDEGGERKKSQVLVPKPSEYREWNFLSPTSM